MGGVEYGDEKSGSFGGWRRRGQRAAQEAEDRRPSEEVGRPNARRGRAARQSRPPIRRHDGPRGARRDIQRTTAKNLADTRRAYVAKGKDSGQKSGSDAPPLPDIFKLMKPGAVGSNQDVLYKMKDLRAHIDAEKAPTSHQVAVNSGLFSFMTTQMPLFAETSLSKRGPRHILLASAWDLDEASRDELFAKAVSKTIDVVWLAPMEAASSRWSVATELHQETPNAS